MLKMFSRACFAPSVAVNFIMSSNHAFQMKTADRTQLFRISMDLYITKTELCYL